MSHSTTRIRAVALSCALMIMPTLAHAQESKEKAEDLLQNGEGVILRVEPLDDAKGKDEKGLRRVKITINTAAVWRDYVRDQANLAKTPDAKAGENSIATKGQPESANTDIIAEVGAATILSLRYRAASDDVSKGARTVEKAEKKEGSPSADNVKTSPRDEKAPKIHVADLKPGLFVYVEAKKGKADKIIVLKPVSDPIVGEGEASPKK